jgi:hypothetical protein
MMDRVLRIGRISSIEIRLDYSWFIAFGEAVRNITLSILPWRETRGRCSSPPPMAWRFTSHHPHAH